MSQDPLLGQTLSDRYQILEKSSEEMLGRVYKARDLRLDRLVHVKILHPFLTANEEKVRRFSREIHASSAIKHPNTVAVLDYGAHGAQHFFVMEYTRGTPLDVVLKQGPLAPDRAAAIAAQIASAMDAAHQQGIIHRNLNTLNVLLLDNANGDFVKVRDFGLSKLDSGPSDEGEDLTDTGARIGNTFYMAPEYIEEGEVTGQADLYSLGCLLHHMLTGSPPFDGRPGQVLMMHISHRAQPPSRTHPAVPSWLDRIVADLMEKAPQRRPPRGRAVVSALEKGAGRSLAPPELLPLDREGQVIRPMLQRTVPVNRRILVVGISVLILLAVLGFAAVAATVALGALWS